ncbi:hypothetical protein [Nocardioides sp.]|uniref:hypothetical protein n=1 Tax=Nocardioides sp. TaxID=35761 RepID=UPI00260EB6FA|nr:hypothetical protein [Nocardioides sp.]
MATKVIADGVHVYVGAENNPMEKVLFSPGDSVPAWAARQMGPHCFTDGNPVEEPATPQDPLAANAGTGDLGVSTPPVDEKPDYTALTKAELVEAIEARNAGRADEDQIEVPKAANKPELVSLLVGDDAVQAANASTGDN